MNTGDREPRIEDLGADDSPDALDRLLDEIRVAVDPAFSRQVMSRLPDADWRPRRSARREWAIAAALVAMLAAIAAVLVTGGEASAPGVGTSIVDLVVATVSAGAGFLAASWRGIGAGGRRRARRIGERAGGTRSRRPRRQRSPPPAAAPAPLAGPLERRLVGDRSLLHSPGYSRPRCTALWRSLRSFSAAAAAPARARCNRTPPPARRLPPRCTSRATASPPVRWWRSGAISCSKAEPPPASRC